MSFRGRLALFLAVFAAGGAPLQAWTPGTGDPTAIQGFVVDTTNRLDVLSFYNTIYPRVGGLRHGDGLDRQCHQRHPPAPPA